MKKPSPIVLGIDFSDSSPILLRHAIHAARSHGSGIVAMHVLDQSLREFKKDSGLGAYEIVTLITEAEERFAKILPSDGDSSNIEFLVKYGKPATELGRVVEEMEASLLVVSANDMTKRRLGSVAARCVRTVACDVLILRDWQGGDFRKIVVCTDFSKTAERALSRAISMAKQSGARLEILNVAYPPELDSWGKTLNHADDSPRTYEEECRAIVRASMDQLLENHADALKGVDFHPVIVESAAPSIAITGHVRSRSADLVVLGTQGNSSFTSHFIGTNAERMIQDAPVSVLAVR